MCVGDHVKGFYFSMFLTRGLDHLSKNNTEMVRFYR